MMSSQATSKTSRLRMVLAAVGAIGSAALFGALLASLLSIDGPNARTRLRNPFDSARSAQ